MELREWLELIIDGLEIHSREGWSQVLGARQETIEEWIKGHTVPGFNNLAGIYCLIREWYPEKGKHALTNVPSVVYQAVRTNMFEDLGLAIHAMDAEKSIPLLESFVKLTNETRLKGRNNA